MAFDPRTKEERKLFPFWTLIVIAGCAALWVFGAKIYQESMAAYQSYAAIHSKCGAKHLLSGRHGGWR